MKAVNYKLQQLSEETQASVAKANDVAEEVISAVRTVKSFACEKFEALRYINKIIDFKFRWIVHKQVHLYT